MSVAEFKNTRKLELKSGEYVFESGQPTESFHLLRRGTMELIRNNKVVYTVEGTECPFGNTEHLLDRKRAFGARAAEDSEIIFSEMDSDRILDWFVENPDKHMAELRHMSSVLDQINRENQVLFEKFRELRDVFAPFLKPLRMIYIHERERVELSSMMSNLLADYLKLINQAGKSGTISVDDIQVGDEVKERFSPGEEICSEGREGSDLYLHLEGTLSVLKEGQLVSSIEKPGLIFGEMAAFLDNERKASVVAETEATVASLPVDDLTDLFSNSPQIARKINKMLVKRFEKADILEDQLSRFHENLRELFKNDRTLNEEREQLEEEIEKLQGGQHSHEETPNHLARLKEWIDSDVEDSRDLLFEGSVYSETDRFTGKV